MIPVRCYTCNRPIAQHWDAFNARSRNKQTARAVLDAEGIVRMCCRIAFITHANPTHDYLPYSNDDVVLDEIGTTLQRRVRHERSVACTIPTDGVGVTQVTETRAADCRVHNTS